MPRCPISYFEKMDRNSGAQLGQNWVFFYRKKVYSWVGKWAKNWYRESQIFKVRQAHPRPGSTYDLAKVTPPGIFPNHN